MTKKDYKKYIGRLEDHVETFESIKSFDEHGNEVWFARDLQKAFGYKEWRNFKKVITKARKQIKKNGKDPNLHLTEVSNELEIKGKNRYGETRIYKRKVVDYACNRYAAYVIAVNTDPSKEEAAIAKEYFVVQTRSLEVIYERVKEAKLLHCREKLKHINKYISAVLLNAEVDECELGIVFSRWDKKLYTLTTKELKKKYGIKDMESLYDYLSEEAADFKYFAQRLSADMIKKSKAKGLEETARIGEEQHEKIRELFISVYGEGPENYVGKSDTKKIKKKYDSLTDEFIQKWC